MPDEGPAASRRPTQPAGSHNSPNHNSLFSGIRAVSHDSLLPGNPNPQGLLPGFRLPEESEVEEGEAAAGATAVAAAAAARLP